jgi:hypothetical protein
MATITNTTPHNIALLDQWTHEVIETYPSSDISIRLEQVEETIDVIDGTEVLRITFNANDSLPAVIEGHYYIVSAIVANAHPERKDFLMVCHTVRDDNGRIKGCTAWAKI